MLSVMHSSDCFKPEIIQLHLFFVIRSIGGRIDPEVFMNALEIPVQLNKAKETISDL